MFQSIKKYQFLFEELTRRDFTKKYKRTALGMFWSILSPLLTLLIMRLIFTHFFGTTIEHYTVYLFAGNIVYSYFNEATNTGMRALINNKDIFAKVNMPKYMFVLSANASSFINFLLTVAVFFLFVALDGLPFAWRFFGLIIPIVCLLGFNIGVSLILSAVNMFFRDTSYLYSIMTMMIMWVSAIFYDVSSYPEKIQRLFLINPVYVYIKFFRVVVIDGNMPSPTFLFFTILYPILTITIGAWMYKKFNNRFMYYV